MTEVYAGFQELFHGNDCHRGSLLVFSTPFSYAAGHRASGTSSRREKVRNRMDFITPLSQNQVLFLLLTENQIKPESDPRCFLHVQPCGDFADLIVDFMLIDGHERFVLHEDFAVD